MQAWRFEFEAINTSVRMSKSNFVSSLSQQGSSNKYVFVGLGPAGIWMEEKTGKGYRYSVLLLITYACRDHQEI